MNVQEVEARMAARLSGLEDQESRLQQWLECLRRVEGIAAEWNVDLAGDKAIETGTKEVSVSVEELELVTELEAVQESLEPVSEESVAAEEQPQTAEDPFDQLRRKLVGKLEHRSNPVFNSRLLFGANA